MKPVWLRELLEQGRGLEEFAVFDADLMRRRHSFGWGRHYPLADGPSYRVFRLIR